MRNGVNYKTLGLALHVIADACLEADRQMKRGEKVTACGLSDEDLESLCEQIPYMLNPLMSTEEVKDRLQVSESTLNRMVARGDLPNGKSKKHGHTRYWLKWDILDFVKKKKRR